MKKRLILFAFILYLGQLSAQTTPVPDPIFEQALIDLNIDSNGLNGNILNSDAAPINQLMLDSLGISDLSGIEAFVNLEWLSAKGNNLASVNLGTNTLLYNLDLSFNQLAGINLSQNLLLTHVKLAGNVISTMDLSPLDSLILIDVTGNLLTQIDVSNNPLLWWFTVRDNQLTSLDVSHNPKLTRLDCRGNLLSQLDLSNNLTLWYLDCSHNLLTDLDVALLDLDALACTDNQIGFLDLTASSNLLALHGYHNQLDSIRLPSTAFILNLFLHDNQLHSLDLSQLGIIKEFSCHSNQLQTLNMRNGANAHLEIFSAYDNPPLTCIQVDNVDFANTHFVDSVDVGVLFSEDCATVGIEEIEEEAAFLIFPNPAEEFLYSSLSSPVTEILIYNELGQIVHRAYDFPLSVAALGKGIYIIQVRTKETAYRTKFIKK